MIETPRLKIVVIFIKTILSFVPWRKFINICNNIAWKYGDVTVKDFRKYEKLEYKKNKLKLVIDFLNNCKQLGAWCIQNSLSLNYRMFLIKTLYHFVKDSFVVPSASAIRNSNILQKNSVYPKTFYQHSFLTIYLQNL